jgi:transposase-like protein
MKPNRRTDPIGRRKAALRARVLRHFEEVTRNVSATCRHFGIHRSPFQDWRRRRQERGPQGLFDDKRGPKMSPWRTPPHIEALALKTRAEKAHGAQRPSYCLQRHHEVYLSVPTIRRILREHQVPRIYLKRYRPGPKKRREISSPANRCRSTSSTSR